MKTALTRSNMLARRRRATASLQTVLFLLALPALGVPPGHNNFSCKLNQRLAEAAARYRKNPPPRAVFHDIAFPANPSEYRSLEKSAVLLITAVTRDASELPLNRLYAVVGGSQVSLPLVADELSRLPSGPAATVFGSYREDAIYLVPAAIVLAGATINVDFATHRSEFTIARFSPTDAPPFIRNDPTPLAQAGARLSSRALIALIEREYPGFRFTKIGTDAYSLSIASCRAR